MLDIDPYMLSEWQVALEHGDGTLGSGSRISLSQPLRAETGRAVLTYLAGLGDAEPVYERATVPLEPEGREVELALTHEIPVGSGRAAFKVAHSWNSGHEPGSTAYAIGASYRIRW